MCPCLCLHYKHALWPIMATLFGSCVCVVVSFEMREAPGARMCVWTCVRRHWYSIALSNPWPNRSHHVCIRRPGCFPSRLAACWCSFQPAWMDNSIPFMLWTCICSSQCFWRFVWMRPSRIASVAAMCMPQWFQGQLASLAREQNVMQSVSQDWNCLLIQERYSSYYILMLNTAV